MCTGLRPNRKVAVIVGGRGVDVVWVRNSVSVWAFLVNVGTWCQRPLPCEGGFRNLIPLHQGHSQRLQTRSLARRALHVVQAHIFPQPLSLQLMCGERRVKDTSWTSQSTNDQKDGHQLDSTWLQFFELTERGITQASSRVRTLCWLAVISGLQSVAPLADLNC